MSLPKNDDMFPFSSVIETLTQHLIGKCKTTIDLNSAPFRFVCDISGLN